MGLESALPIFSQEQINPESPEDYRDEKGILHCKICGKAKQYHVKMGRMDKIVPCICDCKKQELENEKRRLAEDEKKHRIEQLRAKSMMSGRYQTAHFDTYIRRDGNRAAYNAAVCYCKKWQDMYANSQGLLFYGAVGTGKSYTAACIANRLLSKGVSVIMTSFVKILQDIHVATDEAMYMSVLNAAKLLIIDDFGSERNTDYALEKVYGVIDSRLRANKPMILTTNMDIEEMLECSDITYKRVYDRVLEVCYPVEVLGTSMRMTKAAQRYEDMQKLLEKQ